MGLEQLKLSNASTGGNGKDLSPLRSPTHLDLRGTGVSGGVKALSPLRLLTHLDLRIIGVSGDVRALSPLTSLTYLDPYGTKVSSDVRALSPLTSLTHLDLSNSQVSSGVSALSPLTSSTYLDRYGTKVRDTDTCRAREDGSGNATISGLKIEGQPCVRCDVGPRPRRRRARGPADDPSWVHGEPWSHQRSWWRAARLAPLPSEVGL